MYDIGTPVLNPDVLYAGQIQPLLNVVYPVTLMLAPTSYIVVAGDIVKTLNGDDNVGESNGTNMS